MMHKFPTNIDSREDNITSAQHTRRSDSAFVIIIQSIVAGYLLCKSAVASSLSG